MYAKQQRRSAYPTRVPQVGVPFNQRTWSNPVRYRMSSYGRDFTALRNRPDLDRRVANRGFSAPAASILVPGGGQGVEVLLDASAAALYWPAPPGDWEIVVEFAGYTAIANTEMAGPFAVDSSGTGVGASQYNNSAGIYCWNLVSWAYSSTGGSAAWSSPITRQHMWQTLKKSGTTYTARHSDDGSTFTAYTANTTWAGTPAWIGFGRFTAGTIGWYHLYRLNVYPAPAFFTG